MTKETRIDRRFAALKKEGRPALVTFVTAGDPDFETSKKILLGLPEAGADVIELGMPFSDPMADGPPSRRRRCARSRPGRTCGRRSSSCPRIPQDRQRHAHRADGLLQPDLRLSRARAFLDDAVAAGVDGLIVVDVPPEADDELCLPAVERGSTSSVSPPRPPTISACRPYSKNTSGFVYYVSITGITGSAAPDINDVNSQVARIKASDRASRRRRFWRKNARAGVRHFQGRRWSRRWLGPGERDREAWSHRGKQLVKRFRPS